MCHAGQAEIIAVWLPEGMQFWGSERSLGDLLHPVEEHLPLGRPGQEAALSQITRSCAARRGGYQVPACYQAL